MFRRILFISLLAAATVATGVNAQDQFIAGVNPAERPAGAPVVTELNKDGAWYANALFGVSAPYPASLQFLEAQGGWFNPFLRSGMTGPYDIRGWHTSE